MASSINRGVVITLPYSFADHKKESDCNTYGEIYESSDINLNSASIRTPSSPSSSLIETSEFSRIVKVEPVASPTSCLFNSLTDEAQRVPSPPHSALTDIIVDVLKMETSSDWSPLPADLFEVVPFATSTQTVVNVFDQQPAVSPDREDQDHVQLDTPQPQVFNDTPQPWWYPTVSSDVQQQQYEATPASASLVNLESLSDEDITRLLAETAEHQPADQAVFEEPQQQQPVEHGQPVDPLLDHDYVESDGQFLAEFLDTTTGFFQEKDLDLQVAMGSETIANEEDPNFMDSTVNLVPWIEQLPSDEGLMDSDEVPDTALMSNSSAEEMIDSPSTSSRSSSVAPRAGPAAYRHRRDLNNEASRKSRANRKAKFEQAKQERIELESRNHTLLADVSRLEAIRDEWKEKLLQMMGSR